MVLLLPFFKKLGLRRHSQSIDDFVHVSVQDGIQFVKRKTDAVVRYAALREVVGPDALAAVTRADLALTLPAYFASSS